MTWHNKFDSRPMAGDTGSYLSAFEETVQEGAGLLGGPGEANQETFALPEPKFPVAIDPRTGEKVRLGNGTVAVMGSRGIAKIVHFPHTEDSLDRVTASGDLTHSA